MSTQNSLQFHLPEGTPLRGYADEPTASRPNPELSRPISKAGSHQAESEWHILKEHGLSIDGPLERIEPPWSYLTGMHHAVTLGDRLGNKEQYKVIHKLGTGGFANVWLCLVEKSEPTQYVAVKILQARLSIDDESRELANVRRLSELAKTDPAIAQYCLLPLDIFEIDGPNGMHQCFVYPVAGPCVGSIMTVVEDPHVYLRSLTRQAGEAMAALHRHGICHGDFRPSNILLRLEGLTGLSEAEVLDILEPPVRTSIILDDDANPDAYVPPYLVYPVQFDSFSMKRLASDKLCVIDFGESFDASNPPTRGTGIPMHYAAPEHALANTCSTASDIFALAATMYHIRFGKHMFIMEEDTTMEYVYMMVQQIGRFPEPLWSKWVEYWMYVQDQLLDDPTDDERLDEVVVRRRHIQAQVHKKVGHLILTPELEALQTTNEEEDCCGWHEPLPEEERELLQDLLYGMTESDPEKRLSIEQVLQHPWFSYGVERPQSPGRAEEVQSPLSHDSPLASPRSPRSHCHDSPLSHDAVDPLLALVVTSHAGEYGQPKPSSSPYQDARLETPSEPRSPILEIVRGDGQLPFQWTYEMNAVRFCVLAVSAWFCRAFGL
ncbi:kinase-like domain-containing protein [Aspergillus oleicola]